MVVMMMLFAVSFSSERDTSCAGRFHVRPALRMVRPFSGGLDISGKFLGSAKGRKVFPCGRLQSSWLSCRIGGTSHLVDNKRVADVDVVGRVYTVGDRPERRNGPCEHVQCPCSIFGTKHSGNTLFNAVGIPIPPGKIDASTSGQDVQDACGCRRFNPFHLDPLALEILPIHALLWRKHCAARAREGQQNDNNRFHISLLSQARKCIDSAHDRGARHGA